MGVQRYIVVQWRLQKCCAVFEGNISEWYRKGLEVMCSTSTRACEYRVGGYCTGIAIWARLISIVTAISH